MALTQEQLEELVVGKAPDPHVTFYEQAVLDVEASKAAGRRIWKTEVFIKRTFPGVSDWTPQRAREDDIRKHPAEYQYFLDNRQGIKEPGVEILPGLSVVNLQELRDLGLYTIRALAKAQHHI